MKCIRPFKKYPVFTSNGIEECEAMISSTLSDVTILSKAIPDRFQINLATIELGKTGKIRLGNVNHLSNPAT